MLASLKRCYVLCCFVAPEILIAPAAHLVHHDHTSGWRNDYSSISGCQWYKQPRQRFNHTLASDTCPTKWRMVKWSGAAERILLWGGWAWHSIRIDCRHNYRCCITTYLLRTFTQLLRCVMIKFFVTFLLFLFVKQNSHVWYLNVFSRFSCFSTKWITTIMHCAAIVCIFQCYALLWCTRKFDAVAPFAIRRLLELLSVLTTFQRVSEMATIHV